MRFQLRDYQATAVHEARLRVRDGKRNVLIVAPTGAGKTVIGCSIIESAVSRHSSALFLAHRVELIMQTSAKLADIGMLHGIIKAGVGASPLASVQVGSVQTVNRRLHRIDLAFDLIVIDEAHHAVAEGYRKIIRAVRSVRPNCVVLGLTATPYRSDGRGLSEVFDGMVEVATIPRLVEWGYLVPTRVFVGKQRPNLRGVKITAGDYNQQQLEHAMMDSKLVGNIVEEWQRLASDRVTVCFAVDVAHSQEIVRQFQAAGVAAEHLDGATPDDERRAILSRVASGATRLVSNCAVLTEGWDCPHVSAIILARPTKSRGLWRQMIGRCLRPAPGKLDCLILDHAQTTNEHGLCDDPDDISLEVGLKKKGDGKQRSSEPSLPVCESCGRANPIGATQCETCGASLVDEREHIGLGDASFQMVEIDKAAHRIPTAKAEGLFHQEMAYAMAHGYKPGWASYRFKQRTGHWPTKQMMQQCPVPTVWIEREGKKVREFAA